MDPSKRRSTGMERASSLRRSLRLSTGSARYDEDEYDLAAAAVSDGFRPMHLNGPHAHVPLQHPLQTNTVSPIELQTTSEQEIQPESPPRLPLLPQSLTLIGDMSLKDTPGIANRPLSISKPPRPHDSLTLRNDGSNLPRSGPTAASSLSRSSTDPPVIRPQSPYRGPSGPSHPYQMYPQRTLSNATTSTAALGASRSFEDPQRPTHPYNLYPQNIVTADEETAQNHIPVGFNGAGNTYQRRLGPDGEEAGDLIGPLGHTEELPPYTRYPNQPLPGNTSSESSPDVDRATLPRRSLPGAGGIGVATRNPEFSATEEDLQLSRSRPSTASQHDINTAARDIAEKTSMNKWQRRAKKKLWGIIPYWAICLLIVGLVLMGIVMGAVIGTLLSRHKGSDADRDDSGDNDNTPTPIFVEPLDAVPEDLPPLNTGLFSLPPLIASQAPKSCFEDTTQSQTWTCDMPFRFYAMDIQACKNTSDKLRQFEFKLASVNTGAKFLWGTQPPDVRQAMPLTLVNDTYEPGRGPAWWVKLVYDKVVIIPEESLVAAKTKRSDFNGPIIGSFDYSVKYKKKPMGAKDGDKPWICTWPQTTLEIFIYPSQNASLGFGAATATSKSAQPSTTAFEISSQTEYPLPPSPPPSYPKVVKFLERRLNFNDNSKPYCQQIRVIENGQSSKNITDDVGKPIIVKIMEKSNLWDVNKDKLHMRRPQEKRSWYSTEALVSRDLELSPCGCLWWST